MTGVQTCALPIFQNWATVPTAGGSYLCYGPGKKAIPGKKEEPGDMTRFGSVLSKPEREGIVLFAGEHCSDQSQGYMNGAVETGIAAAIDAIKMRGMKVGQAGRKVSESKTA